MIHPIKYNINSFHREFCGQSEHAKSKQSDYEKPTLLSDNSKFFGKQTPNTTKTSIFYINDFHGKASSMERTITASNAYDSFVPQNHTDKLKLSSGDIMLGDEPKINNTAAEFLKITGIMASAVGNHECDMKAADFYKIANDLNTKFLACNISNEPQEDFSKFVSKSYVQEINGTKYGIIGTLPSDLISRIKYGKVFQSQNIKPDNIENTIKDIQKEIDKFKSQGINKIILLSHSGYGYDIEIAKNTDGLDVILGGHSHNLVKDVKKNVNLFSSKSGEPVVITQAGRDGKYFGILNLEFDKNGIITRVQNNVATTGEFRRNAVSKYIFEKIQGKPEVIGKIRTAPPALNNDLTSPSPLAYFGADAIREKAGADIALIGAANIRGSFDEGDVDTSEIEEISPFKNKMVKIECTEKEIVDAIKFSAKSMTNPNNKPGIMYASGLTYALKKDGTVTEMEFVDQNGTKHPINVNSPRTDKKYTVAINDYFCSGNDGYDMLNKYFQAITRYDWDLNKAIEEKIRDAKAPIDFTDDGRIRFLDK